MTLNKKQFILGQVKEQDGASKLYIGVLCILLISLLGLEYVFIATLLNTPVQEVTIETIPFFLGLFVLTFTIVRMYSYFKNKVKERMEIIRSAERIFKTISE